MHSYQQKVTHLHYHYHCNHTHCPPIPREEIRHSQTLLHSQTHPVDREESRRATVQQSRGLQAKQEGERSFKKLKVSNCWSTDSSTNKTQRQEGDTQAPDVSSFTVQEKQTSFFECDGVSHQQQHEGKGLFEAEQVESLQSSIIIRYQREIQKLRQEVDRLRMVEQECVYLRKACLDHYQRCPIPHEP